ncbi:hypothetical protein BD311DRAFT_663191 [Dichomitus squalens]|uniref:Uncharacterized protein n=1 Tax=Dichomitus squalens TaxID=114155 RepID=A0A4Q9MME7_9APHY|nr:hypothetical protein BD311DRAFT_663191 [Dichomitus squalens]
MAYIPFHSKRVDSQVLGSAASTDLTVWLFFEIAGDQILLPLLVLTFLCSRTGKRHPTVVNVCATCIITGVVSLLLFYNGQQVGPEPERGLCIAQMALISPVPPMTSVAALALVYYIWSTFRQSKVNRGPRAPMSRLTTICLLIAPYITHVCFAAVALRLGLQHPEKVNRSRRFFYCSLHEDSYNDVMIIFTAVVCLIAAALQVHLVVMLSRNWTALRRAGLSTGVDIHLTIRVGVFIFYTMLASGVTLVTFSPAANATSVLPDMFAASIGTMLFLIFASQPDVIRTWSRILLCPFTLCGPFREPRTLPPSRAPTPLPSFDDNLLERTDSDASEKARLAALHAYFKARVNIVGCNVEVIKRPEDAFTVERVPIRI